MNLKTLYDIVEQSVLEKVTTSDKMRIKDLVQESDTRDSSDIYYITIRYLNETGGKSQALQKLIKEQKEGDKKYFEDLLKRYSEKI